MCDGSKECGKCRSRTASAVEVNKATVKLFDGRKVVVVPVVMAKGDVVMNGGLLPVEEYEPLSWAGIPVTVGHPDTNGSFASARDPSIHEEWVVGNLYNVQVIDGSLRAEAWVDIEKADRVHPGLVNRLVKGTPIDVSTGYYCSAEDGHGQVNGREYIEVQRDIIPDHLALLPNEEGACNWNDGCGVRSNITELTMPKKVRHALKVIANALAGNKDATPTVDDIIANKNSPYTEEDRESLSKMSVNTLGKIAASFAGNADDEEEVENEEEEEKVENADEEEEVEDEEDEEDMKNKKNALTPADREALAFARNHAADHRRGLVAKITGNTTMKAADLKDWSLGQLELLANSFPTGSYAGRAAANAGEEDSVADGMMSTGVLNVLRKKKENA